ncbi:hypothetical protein [Altererythrobacter sp. Z27]|uniref:hypothetical protein n=1 Tax=Altererythrobacter sp. Z27 TaxID=3461147 RepID=UPI0040443590
MPDLRKLLISLAPLPLLVACVSAGSPPPVSQPRPGPVTTAPPAVRVPPSNPAPPTSGFIVPQVMRLPGLENVIGAGAAQLERRFGKPRLDVLEGDARKLQFAGEPCVLDVFLYPMQPGAAPVATHVEARRASDGRNVDRAACVAALGGG